MDARKSLAVTSLIGAIPGGVLAFVAAMGGISGATGLLMIGYWLAAAIGLVLALLPVLAVTNIWPKTGPARSKSAGAKSAPEKGAAAGAVAEETASEEIDLAEDEEFAEVSDEFTAVSDSEFEFEEADEFDEEDEGR